MAHGKMSGQINVFDNYLPEPVAERISNIVFGVGNLTNDSCDVNGSIPFLIKIDKTSPGMISFASMVHTKTMQYNEQNPTMRVKKALHDISTKFLLSNRILDGFEPLHGRLYLQVPMAIEQIHKTPHVNLPSEHWVVLYYINDADGTTAFYNTDGSLRTEVEPKRNRLVIFDGTIKHSVGIPKISPRAVLTYDMIPE